VEKKQFDLCLKIIRRFHDAGILNDLILIGSWCAYFYQDYFAGTPYADRLNIKTRDIDFLIDNPSRIKRSVNIPELLADLGFVTIFKGSKGYIKLEHPDLLLEFLVPEKGRTSDKPHPLPQLGLNATPLRFLNFLSANTLKAKMDQFQITVPHPANFALHKLIIFQRRTREEKAEKDRRIAIEILHALIKKGDVPTVKRVFNSIPQKWQKKILKGLDDLTDREIIDILK